MNPFSYIKLNAVLFNVQNAAFSLKILLLTNSSLIVFLDIHSALISKNFSDIVRNDCFQHSAIVSCATINIGMHGSL